ncbi:MAG TPA: DUF6766 family protein [Myxococcota bacterium]|jgi:hypothetical protein|nr:DUF6766 family protein [Myxococcota bacterium]
MGRREVVRREARERRRGRPRRPREQGRGLRRRLRDNGLSLVAFGLFALFLGAQAVTGHRHRNEERRDHDQPPIGFAAYLASGDFVEATTENWESEFLQMGAYVLLTAVLFQRGSGESKKLDEAEAVDRAPRRRRPDAPWPVRRGGVAGRLYEHSLGLAFLALFLLSFGLHAVGGARAYSDDQRAHGGEPVGVTGYVTTPRFWFESFQNWQSEFLALGAMAVLSVFLRERGSPESKPVDAPHAQTGSE